ncbi:flagellar basal body FlgE domain-containing protein [Buchnera aphidicola (Chaitoregma tattakana)]|uniref:flagellar basal body FlgE domain-containing protein n=1 Tax=Buchnera aphidicola TaxID=9 RepID=UPI0031B81CA9
MLINTVNGYTKDIENKIISKNKENKKVDFTKSKEINTITKTDKDPVDIYKVKSKNLITEIFFNIQNKRQALNYGVFRLVDKSGNVSFSSKRDFTMNDELKIVNSEGKYFTGHLCDDNNISGSASKPEIIDFSKKFVPIITKTKEIKIDANLNENEDIKREIDFDPKDPFTYTRKRSIKVYDKTGHYNDVDIYFLKNAQNSWRIISINRKNNEKYDQNYIFYNRYNKKVHIMGSGIIVRSDFDQNSRIRVLFKCNDITTYKNAPTSFKNVQADGEPLKSLNHYDILPSGDIIGVFSDDTRGKLGSVRIIPLPADVIQCFINGYIRNDNKSLINFIKTNEVKKTF